MKHAREVQRYPGTTAELAEDLGNLSYGGLAALLRCLGEKIARDAAADLRRQRMRLASDLSRLGELLLQSVDQADGVWTLCKPHMPASEAKSRTLP